MRWNELFADLEGRVAADELAELRAEVADRTRRDRATVTLGDRFAASLGARVRVDLASDLLLDGVVQEVGDGWLLLDRGESAALVVLDRIVQVRGLPRASDARPGVSRRRFGIGVVLRELARDRASVRVHAVGGLGAVGVVSWVGADHVEISRTGGDRVGARGQAQSVLIANSALMCLTSRSRAVGD